MGSAFITDEGIPGVPRLSVVHEDRVGVDAKFPTGTVCAPALASIMAIGGRRLMGSHLSFSSSIWAMNNIAPWVLNSMLILSFLIPPSRASRMQ